MYKIGSHSDFDFYTPEFSDLQLPLAGEINCGFPSPADDFVQESIDLNKMLIKHPDATFYAVARGYSLSPLVNPGDVMIIDKSAEWTHDVLACCFIDGEFTAKWIEQLEDKIRLMPLNPEFPILEYTPEKNNIYIWGVITAIINKNVRLSRLQ